MIAEHLISGVKRTVLRPLHWLWCFLFGFLYYAVKGMWGLAVLSFFTFNGLWVIFPIMNRSIVRTHYERSSWRIVRDD